MSSGNVLISIIVYTTFKGMIDYIFIYNLESSVMKVVPFAMLSFSS